MNIKKSLTHFARWVTKWNPIDEHFWLKQEIKETIWRTKSLHHICLMKLGVWFLVTKCLMNLIPWSGTKHQLQQSQIPTRPYPPNSMLVIEVMNAHILSSLPNHNLLFTRTMDQSVILWLSSLFRGTCDHLRHIVLSHL